MRSYVISTLVVSMVLAAAPPIWGQGLENVDTVVIDPGHGGANEGAFGVAGVFERFLTLDLAYRLRQHLAQQFPDLQVELTRMADVDVELGARMHFANVAEADVFVSIHFNSSDNRRAHGIEVFYLASDSGEIDDMIDETSVVGPSDAVSTAILHDLLGDFQQQQSARLAQIMLESLVTATDAMDRGVRQADFAVLRGARMPAVVIELGFLSHPDEGYGLVERTYTDTMVQAIADGIAAFDAAWGEPLP